MKDWSLIDTTAREQREWYNMLRNWKLRNNTRPREFFDYFKTRWDIELDKQAWQHGKY